MNIKITYNWLLEFLQTDANPYEIQKYLSLSGPSIENVEKIGDDYVFDIEITSNRIDTASVVGIAQEAQAILPMYGKKAEMKENPLMDWKFENVKTKETKKIYPEILSTLCSRFNAVIFTGINIGPAPDFMSKRLRMAGIKSINNVVDISNYLMVTLGQPVHVFDYDKIKGGVMKMRLSNKGESIVTLDGKTVKLHGGEIVIEDGSGKLIDLCGIMGGQNSSISESTKNVVLFVQTYNKERIRRAEMQTGIRTVASTYFEKGLDEERVEPTAVYGAKLLKKYATGETASKIYDIYLRPDREKKIKTTVKKIVGLIGVDINNKIIGSILNNLGFKTSFDNDNLTVLVPFYRKYDVAIPEDLVEEVARIYGYQNIPSVLQSLAYIEQPQDMEKLFVFQNRIKLFLKHFGLNEIINYSMISKDLLEEFGMNEKNHLKIADPLSKEIEYLRTTLVPSLYKNIEDNTGKKEVMKFFEIGKIYLPQKGNLPKEIYRVGMATNTDYFDIKGIIESLYKELNIDSEVDEKITEKNGIYMTEIDLKKLIDSSQPIPKYIPINSYAVIKLDKTFPISSLQTYSTIKKKASESKLLQNIQVVALFGNKLTLRFYYSSVNKNITEEEAKKELEKV